ncbi:MAG TPA: GH92 family glycosyl hydrolase, partial [Pyrinomonadaceae bacterium]|nr:GH92 family glycosyl hydrolase [Pyrinomonadaceae bacterium]
MASLSHDTRGTAVGQVGKEMTRSTGKYKETKGEMTLRPSRLSHRFCVLILLLTAYCLPLSAQKIDYTRWVNPFIGTGGHGHTFPGATTPFGMVQLSPDTRTDNWDGSSGYHYSDDVIYGFSHTHLSGTGIPDYCDILFMPSARESYQGFPPKAMSTYRGYPASFSHSDEKAEPGYYSVRLADTRILAEMTATPRTGLHRYTFPESDEATIFLDLNWRDQTIDADSRVVNSTTVEGFRRSKSWAKDQVIYFVAVFSKPFERSTDSGRADGEKFSRLFPFKTKRGEQILIKVALSPVSIEGARKNLAAEMPGWDFDKVRADAEAAWNKELSKIEVSGGTDAQTTTFYTALYHTMIQPNIFEDVDGSYRGHDGKVHNIRDDASPRTGAEEKGRRGADPKSASHEYTVFSLWDTFRAAHPLYTIIDHRRTVDFINTFIRQYEQGGRLPVWELAGNETDCMIGYHAVSVIADGMAKGIKGFDYEKAYEAAKHSAELDREGLAAYKRRGYISMEDTNESVSKTLEYAYDDWCIAQMAAQLMSTSDLDSPDPAKKARAKAYSADMMEFSRRAHSYENLYDPSTGFMRPKKNGGFVSPFAPNEVTFNYTEGNAWVYSFFAFQHTDNLIRLHGGKANFERMLDGLFTTTDKLAGREQPDITGLIGQYAHGNEPSHHIAYLYNFTDSPWKTQKYVRQILDDFYKPAPDGLIGNEDCGQMSAWYVLSASGIYPLPPFGVFELGTPLFKEVKYHLENGKTFTIRGSNASPTYAYVAAARLNGKRLTQPKLGFPEMMKGGVLDFDMSATPAMNAYSPAGYYGGDQAITFFTPVPVVGDGTRVFRGSRTVKISDLNAEAKIYYTLDGSEPSERSARYSTPLTINKTTTINALAINQKGVKSHVAEATYNLIPNNWTVKIDSKYNRQYTGGGDEGLIDGIRGTTSFASGEW